MMGLLDKLKSGATGIILLAGLSGAVATSGCRSANYETQRELINAPHDSSIMNGKRNSPLFSFITGRDKVDGWVVAHSSESAEMTINHEIHKNAYTHEIDCAFDTHFNIRSPENATFDVKIYGRNREFLWMYRIETNGKKGDIFKYKLKMWDSGKNSS
jgi:hypothetical protein